MRTDGALVLCAALLAGVPAGSSRAEVAESVLLPGIDLRDISLNVGDWCRYLVVDEAMGEVDSSRVYVAITGRERRGDVDAFWLEIESAPVRTDPADRDVFKVLIDASVKTMAPDDSLYRHVRKMYVRRGRKPVEAGDPHDLDRVTIMSPESRSGWTVTQEARVTTPAGEFACEVRRFEKDTTREVPAGRVKIVQHRVDRVAVWISERAPVFHLVRCEIERVRESRTVPAVQGIPQAGPKRSRTTSLLVGAGGGARPLLKTP